MTQHRHTDARCEIPSRNAKVRLLSVDENVMADQPLTGLPPQQVQAWLDSVQDQARKVTTRVQQLQGELARLQEQEMLLQDLLASAVSLVS